MRKFFPSQLLKILGRYPLRPSFKGWLCQWNCLLRIFHVIKQLCRIKAQKPEGVTLSHKDTSAVTTTDSHDQRTVRWKRWKGRLNSGRWTVAVSNFGWKERQRSRNVTRREKRKLALAMKRPSAHCVESVWKDIFSCVLEFLTGRFWSLTQDFTPDAKSFVIIACAIQTFRDHGLKSQHTGILLKHEQMIAGW